MIGHDGGIMVELKLAELDKAYAAVGLPGSMLCSGCLNGKNTVSPQQKLSYKVLAVNYKLWRSI